jgi:DNA-binding response OmpR family regulator
VLAIVPLDASVTLAIVGHLLPTPRPDIQPPPSPVPSGVVVDHEGREAWIDATLLDLTFLEFELLDFLVANPWKVFSRRQLLARVWRRGQEDDSRTVDVHVHRLRHKLGARYGQCLVTVRHVGYKFIPPAAEPGPASPSPRP